VLKLYFCQLDMPK